MMSNVIMTIIVGVLIVCVVLILMAMAFLNTTSGFGVFWLDYFYCYGSENLTGALANFCERILGQ